LSSRRISRRSPDARQVAFVSDRSGNPQIYALDAATK